MQLILRRIKVNAKSNSCFFRYFIAVLFAAMISKFVNVK